MTNNARKLPKQSRSIATVEAILEATTHILLREGAEGLTTNHVAEMAGVSIGSLYQYFPNKASLIAALIDRHVNEEVHSLEKIFSEWAHPIGKPLFELIIEEFIEIHLRDIELTKILHEQVSHVECRDALRKATHYFESVIEALLQTTHKGRLPPETAKVRAFVITNTIDSMVQLALVENTVLLQQTEFLDELVNIATQVFERKA